MKILMVIAMVSAALLGAVKSLAADFAISATPTSNASSSNGFCQFVFVGTANYRKLPNSVYGWAPSAGTNVHTIIDTNRTDTKVEYLGKTGDKGCQTTTVSIPDPPTSTKYRFTVYFPNNVPTNAPYWLSLQGFDP